MGIQGVALCLADRAYWSLLTDGALQRVAEHGVDGLDHPHRDLVAAALAAFLRAALRIGTDGDKHVPADPSTPDRWHVRESQ